MNNSSETSPSNLMRAIALTGLIAGTMDITAALTFFTIRTGNSPIVVLQFISSAVFGREEAFSGNVFMMILGVVFHYIIAYTWTTIFFLSYPKISALRRNKILIGVAYGTLVWLVMNLVVIPMTRIAPAPFNPTSAIIGAVILMVCIGLPISIRANGYYSAR